MCTIELCCCNSEVSYATKSWLLSTWVEFSDVLCVFVSRFQPNPTEWENEPATFCHWAILIPIVHVLILNEWAIYTSVQKWIHGTCRIPKELSPLVKSQMLKYLLVPPEQPFFHLCVFARSFSVAICMAIYQRNPATNTRTAQGVNRKGFIATNVVLLGSKYSAERSVGLNNSLLYFLDVGCDGNTAAVHGSWRERCAGVIWRNPMARLSNACWWSLVPIVVVQPRNAHASKIRATLHLLHGRRCAVIEARRCTECTAVRTRRAGVSRSLLFSHSFLSWAGRHFGPGCVRIPIARGYVRYTYVRTERAEHTGW